MSQIRGANLKLDLMDRYGEPETGGESLTIEPDWLAISCISLFSAALGLFLLF